jgi:hypothetical protein
LLSTKEFNTAGVTSTWYCKTVPSAAAAVISTGVTSADLPVSKFLSFTTGGGWFFADTAA